jgi:taurine dioxygenase
MEKPMASFDVKPLGDDLKFGARISGVTFDTLEDAANRKRINEIFEDRGMIIFEDVEPSGHMHVAISNVFGPLKEHATRATPRVSDTLPGVIDVVYDQNNLNVVEIGGKPLQSWVPWHFDHCYNNELNRAGVLRAIDVAPEGALTGFADGIELYNAITPALRKEIEDRNILYSLDLAFSRMRFGKPENFRVIEESAYMEQVVAQAKTQPRAIHPAVWTRNSGEKVFHVSPWMALGIEGMENPEGDALLEAVSQEINTKTHSYYHQWKQTEMLVWDNWRMLHCVSGMDPRYERRMQRTTIKGDYGLGYFEGGAKKGDAVLEMTF